MLKTVLFIVVFLIPGVLQAQQEEVRVVKPYTPTLSGAEKIQLLPRIGQEVSYETPDFDYSIFPKRYETGFRLRPIKPARMVRPALDKLYKSQLTLGGGNYLTPLAELRINQLRSSDGTFGVVMQHQSINGQVRLENDTKVDAGFNENRLEFYGNRFGRRTIFEYKAGANYNAYVHYGVDTAFADTVSRETMTHPYLGAYGALGFQSARPDSFHLQYRGELQYDFFTHDFDQLEHDAAFEGSLSQLVRDFRVGGDIGVRYTGHPGGWDTLFTNQFVVHLDPYITKTSDEWMFRAGVNAYTEIRDGVVKPRFYLNGKFSFNIVEEVLVPYMGVDGYQEVHSYRSLAGENPYVVPGLSVMPTHHKIIVYAGIKGKVIDQVGWNFRGSYSVVDDQYFFVTDTTDILHNQFGVLYDDMTVLNLHGEFNIRPMESLQLFLEGDYYDYQMVRESYAWYKSAFNMSLRARYNIGDKILADAGAVVIGPRYYPSLVAGGDPGKLNTTVDINMGLEYRYTGLLSFWAKFNNMTARPYYAWYNYPSYRFRFLLGFTYAL